MNTKRTNKRHSGIGLVYAIIIMIALCAICSLALDYGRVQLAKTQLRGAADAAALAAGQWVLSDLPAARDVAVSTAKANRCDGSPVLLESADIEFIKWDSATRTYQTIASGSSEKPNAVRVTAHRIAARGTAIDLPFAKLVGANTCDVNTVAIALAMPTRYAAVGLDFVTMSGNASNSYRTKNGVFGEQGNIASNGDITLSGSALIYGNAYPGVGRRVKTSGSAKVTGTSTPLTRPLSYAMPLAGNYASVNDNGRIPAQAFKSGSIVLSGSQTASIPGGVYYLKDFTLSGGSSVTFTGPVTIYCTGKFTLSGSTRTSDDLPENLKLFMLTTGTQVDLSGSSALYAEVYAPGSKVTVSGSGDIYGGIIGKSLTLSGTAAIHRDMNLKGGVMLVK